MGNTKFTILDFARKKNSGEKISVLTAYDFPIASLAEKAGIDSVLVGDSLGMVALGLDTTLPVTMDEMIHHAKAVRRGVKNAFLIGDMPFLSYQTSDSDAIFNAGRFMKEAGCEAVKIEGTGGIIPRVEAIVSVGIPVMGHIGLTPQRVSMLGGYKVQGKDDISAQKLFQDAVDLEKAGCFSVVLECVPKDLADKITKKLKIPTIGIGAGYHCDGQVLVANDMIGYYDKFTPSFVKKYADIGPIILEAFKNFRIETEKGIFPDESHSYNSNQKNS
ncbi:MAG: 3-methyl-2-oxobutanoate hydroxymethyltransferase [Candidatus Omnitrophica bacterium]|nr:3-methyl-2-oxobutanoate hydroxymethyltransferase [Candidatus Omnitrophota bacterium]